MRSKDLRSLEAQISFLARIISFRRYLPDIAISERKNIIFQIAIYPVKFAINSKLKMTGE